MLWMVPAPGRRDRLSPTPTVPVARQAAHSPGFIKKGNLECLDISVSVCLCQNKHLTTLPHPVCAPGHHHLQKPTLSSHGPPPAWPPPGQLSA